MTALLIPCNCDCHNDECTANHGYNGAYSSYCSGCDAVAEYQAECGCCLNAEIGPIDGPGAIHRAVAILAAAEVAEVSARDKFEALADLEYAATRMAKLNRGGAQWALALVRENLDALEAAV